MNTSEIFQVRTRIRMNAGYRLGLDIGGTFTDLALVSPAGALRLHKVLTTLRDPAEGALRGFDELCAAAGVAPAGVDTLIHGTTLVTNAIIARRGVPTALLCTRGFRDILEMGTEQRYDIYDLFLKYPEPLVPRRWRVEITERISRDGENLDPLDSDEVRACVRALVAQGVESVAVVFLHSYRNPAHEQAVRDLLQREFPSLRISISSEVAPEIREYERTCTTVCNAYVQPLVEHYLDHLERALVARGFAGRFFLMQSSGAVTGPEVARLFPVRLLESGPAAGALAAAHVGTRTGRSDLVAFDMGGTTAKICVIQDGRPQVAPAVEIGRVHRFKRGSGLPINTPVVEMIEIGAGGGSIARMDAMGLMRVGPESAEASPGPACYGFGGTESTVTDACVVLGYFDPAFFLGGTMPLDRQAAAEAVRRVGAQVGLDAAGAAWGIYSIVCENMAQAARVHIIERGLDPRRFALMGFGGAGPATAARVARLLGMRQVVIPQAPGVASAVGLLVAPLGFDLVHSLVGELAQLDWAEVDRLLQALEAQGRERLAAAGGPADGILMERYVGMRYVGQFHEIEVPVPPGRITPAVAAVLDRRFQEEYGRLYGLTLNGYAVQTINWRVLVRGPEPRVDMGTESGPGPGADARKGERRAYFPEAGGYVSAPVYDRGRLAPGSRVAGPALVEEREATAVVGAHDVLTVDASGNLVIHVGGSES